MGIKFICEQCGLKRGCNPTGDPLDFRDCGKCDISRDACIRTIGYKREIYGKCFACVALNKNALIQITSKGRGL